MSGHGADLDIVQAHLGEHALREGPRVLPHELRGLGGSGPEQGQVNLARAQPQGLDVHVVLGAARGAVACEPARPAGLDLAAPRVRSHAMSSFLDLYQETL